MPRLLSVGVLVGALLLLISSLAFAASDVLTQTTTSYTMTLKTGPVEMMVMPDQAKGATTGEVMATMPGMPMPSMVMTDQGHAVNLHLEVQIVNKATGKVVTDQLPVITVTNQKSGASHPLTSVTAMYGATAGPTDWHFGNNIFLADGAYTVTVKVGSETATFSNVVVGAPAIPSMPMAAPAAPASLPKTGGLPVLPAASILGLALVAGGAVLRRRSDSGKTVR